MYTTSHIVKNLEQLGILPSDTVMVHASLKSVGKLENGADTVLDAMCGYLREGLLVLPGHTWAYVDGEHPEFDVMKSPVCVGALPEVFRKRSGVYRSLHPTHSLLAYGPYAGQFVSGQERFDTPCAPGSCYGELERRAGKVMLVGVDFMRCTLIHCIEEIAGVPGRIAGTYEQLRVKDKEGRVHSVPSHRHQNANSDYYQKLEPVMDHRGVLTRGKIGDAATIVCEIKDLFGITLELLGRDIRLFDDDKPVPEEWYKGSALKNES